jgi:hypothetical protein
MTETKELNLVAINNEINVQLADETVKRALLATTFKGLQPTVMKQAIMEGMMRGFTFKEFLERDIYPIPYGSGYSLVESIGHVRKIGMRAGIVGKSAPSYEMDGKNVVSCTITVKRNVNGYIGEYTATVFFSEFTTGKNLWVSKPRMMLAKVSEMHALRMACPEELAQAYIEEEMESEIVREESKVARVETAQQESKTITMGALAKTEHANSNKKEEKSEDTEEDITLFQSAEDREAQGK